MNDSLYLSPAGIRGISQRHDDVATRLSQLLGSAPEASLVESTHGHIADAVYTALGAALPSRETTLGITQTASQTISDLVRKALQQYEQGDAEGAAKLQAAADTLQAEQGDQGGSGAGGSGATSSGTSGSGGSDSASGSGSGADTAGQIAGQVGQQVALFGQVLAQSVQGLAQIPQQVMQGVQGIVAAVVGAGATGGLLDDKAEPDGKGEDERLPDDEAQPGGKGDGGQVPQDTAEPGGQGHGPAPDVPVHRAMPAQTRPQQSPL
jgi:hypothetical protein